MADLAWWQALASGAAGGFLTLVGQWLAAIQSRVTKREEREEGRSDASKDRAQLQEVKHLPELAIALDALFESTQRYSWARRQRRNPSPPPAYQPTGQEGTNFRDAVARAEELEATTLSRSVREAAQGYINVCKETVDPVDERGYAVDEWDLFVSWHDGRKAAKDKIGERLRTIYGEQP